MWENRNGEYREQILLTGHRMLLGSGLLSFLVCEEQNITVLSGNLDQTGGASSDSMADWLGLHTRLSDLSAHLRLAGTCVPAAVGVNTWQKAIS